MQKSTDMWFRYLNEGRALTEGLRDIGLPESVIDYIEEAMSTAPEKSKMLMGNLWKESSEENRATLTGLQYQLVNAFVKEYSDYVYPSNLSDEGTPRDVEANSFTPFDMNKPEQERRMLSPEEQEAAKKVKFVIQNVRNGVAKPFGTWRKMIMKAVKALSKAGLPSEKVETTKEDLNNMLLSRFKNWWYRYDEIAAFLNDDPTNYELAKEAKKFDGSGFDIEELAIMARNFLDNKEDPDQIIHQFDDGYYWINLQTTNCPVEAERMGHCGDDSRGTLISLRKRKGERKESSSYVTMTWNGDNMIVYQIKGRYNRAPDEEFWPHIAWFIDEWGAESVEETGEHSDDYEGFVEMNQWLSENTSAEISLGGRVDVDELIMRVQETVDREIERFYDNREENENTSVSCEVESGEDMGGDPANIYLYMQCEANYQINLGWKGFEFRNGEFTPTLGPDDTTQDENLETIPRDSWGGAGRDFTSEIGLDDLSYEIPGEDPEVQYEVTMMRGFDPNWELGDPEAPATAHLEITITNRETGVSEDPEEGNADDFSGFVDAALIHDREYAKYAEKIRRALVDGNYTQKSEYDRSAEELSSMKLENFTIYNSDEGIEFWFRGKPAAPGATVDTLINSNVKIPNLVKQYALAGEGMTSGSSKYREERLLQSLYTKAFGGGRSDANRIESDSLNNSMAEYIQAAYASKNAPDPSQLSLGFGDQYKSVPPKIVLAKDATLSIIPDVIKANRRGSSQPGAYDELGIAWRYTIKINNNSPSGEAEVVKNVLEFINNNPQIVIDAANKIIQRGLDELVNDAKDRRKKVLDPERFAAALSKLRSMHGANAELVDNPAVSADAMKIILLLRWFENNYEKMGETQKYVMWRNYLTPLVNTTFRIHGPEGQIELPDDESAANYGMPRNFEDQVYSHLVRLGATDSQARSGRTVTEDIESQIERIDNLLNEVDDSYDLRMYEVHIGCTISKDVGGSESETATEIRGIPGVTTVRPVADKKRDITSRAEYVLYDIKFELLGARSRTEYRDEILLPALRKIKGLKVLTVSSMHRTNRQGTIRTVRESKVMKEYIGGFGGLAGALGSQRSNISNRRPTPRPAVQSMIDDWADGGVMAYDAPTDSTDMRYHTMMPVEDLLPYMSRVYRGNKMDFDGRYKNFIRTGATYPVYLAIGQNGRAKVTGSEDLIWFAKKAGLKELPVFLSFQKQV